MALQPFYELDGITIYHGDALSPELVSIWAPHRNLVTDPPYGIMFRSNKRDKRQAGWRVKGDESTALRDAAIKEWLAHDTTPGHKHSAGVVFGSWKVPPPEGEVNRLVWWKTGTPGMGNLKSPFGHSHEEIHMLGKAWNMEEAISPYRFKRAGSVLAVGGLRGGSHGEENKFKHPTVKPVRLMERLIERMPRGRTIVDPFAGTGATVVAARNLGQKVIAIELEERYCEVIAKRLGQQVLQFG